MKQRINLYRGKGDAPVFDMASLTAGAVIVGIVFVLVAGTGFTLKYFADEKRMEYKTVSAEVKKVKDEIKQLAAKQVKKEVRSELVGAIKEVESRIISQQNLRKLLYKVESKKAYGFSPYLQALSHSSRSESWLEHFVIDLNKHSFQVKKGGAANGPMTSLFFETLGKTRPFGNMAITSLGLEVKDWGMSFTADVGLRINE